VPTDVSPRPVGIALSGVGQGHRNR